ncbi:MAG: hypothetical protein HYZ75_13895 [Elusimicrobia bacterium]|nr:hypothetical protein [Elusimicrobiota bacterium]
MTVLKNAVRRSLAALLCALFALADCPRAFAQARAAVRAGASAPSALPALAPAVGARTGAAMLRYAGLPGPSLVVPSSPIPAAAAPQAAISAFTAAAAALPPAAAAVRAARSLAVPRERAAVPVADREPRAEKSADASLRAAAEGSKGPSASAALQGALFDGARPRRDTDTVLVSVAPSVPARSLLGPAAAAAGLGAAGLTAAWGLSHLSASELHVGFGLTFGWMAMWQAVTGTLSLLRPVLLESLDPALPEQVMADFESTAFSASPAAAARAALEASGPGAKIRTMTLRTAPTSGRKRWYEFELEDGRVVNVHGRTGKVIRSPRSRAFILGQAERWLGGSAWKVEGRPELLTEDGEYYRKGETPHYRVRLSGPGDHEAFFSARDGRLLAVHSRLSRVLRWVGMGPHAWGIKLLRPYDALKRLVAPLLMGAPLVIIAATALWMRVSGGFALDLPSLSWSAYEWHRFFGSYALFALLTAATTGPLSMLIPLVNKHVTPALPPLPAADPAGFVLSPAEAAEALGPGAAVKRMEARWGGGEAWYAFVLADGSEAAVSAADGKPLPPVRDGAWVSAAAARWLEGSPWSPKGAAVPVTEFDDLFRKGELPAYRLELDGPGGFVVYLSARDGRLIPTYGEFSRLERFLERRIYGVHALDFGFFSRHETLRRALLIAFVTAPVFLTVLAAFAARWGF